MNFEQLLGAVLVVALVMFFTWALEVHRTLREMLVELKRVREELEDRTRMR